MIPKVFAQCVTLPDTTIICGPINSAAGINNLGDLVSRAIPIAMGLAGFGLLLMIIWGGFSLLTGAADPKQLEAGKKRLTYAIVGFLLIFFAYWLVRLLTIIFGLKEFGSIFGG